MFKRFISMIILATLLCVGYGMGTAHAEAFPPLPIQLDHAVCEQPYTPEPYYLSCMWVVLTEFALDMGEPTVFGYTYTSDQYVEGCQWTLMDGSSYYCKLDSSIYISESNYATYSEAGYAGSMFVLGHEYGHHLQNMHDSLNVNNERELQATCYAGVYAGWLVDNDYMTNADFIEALEYMTVIGDHQAAYGIGYYGYQSAGLGTCDQYSS